MEFGKLKELCEFEKGSTGLAKAEPGDYPLVTTGAERKSCNTYQFDAKAVCIPLVSSTGHGHASLKNVHYQEGKFALGSILVALTSKDDMRLNIQFLHLYLSQLKDQVLVPLMSGAANVALSVKKVQEIEIPLPTIERQHEIVERFKSIVIEENELKSELTYQQNLLKKLRQQILQEAMEGKLTVDWRSQNPHVEPASELLKRIAAEKSELVKEKKIKAQKPLPPITDDEKPFDLPQGWEWCHIVDLLENKSYALKAGPFGSSLTKAMYSSSGYKVYGQEQVIKQDPHYGDYYITQEKYDDLASCKVAPGDILISLVGTIGKLLILPDQIEKGVINPRLIKINLHKSLIAEYFSKLYSSNIVQRQLKDSASGQTMPVISIKILKSVCFPIPPAKEQRAIVTKVEKLFALCDKLESQITQNQTHAEQLMQAVLKEAFSHNSEAEPAAITKSTVLA
ncbi:MAG: restriction endonuclease subunit S [Hyphomicrobiales bacterium]